MKIKEKILKVAFKLFIQKGFREVSINDLIKEVNITKNDFYQLFNSKDQLISDVIEEFIFPFFGNVIKVVDKCNEMPKNKLLKIFRECSEMESYLKNNFNIDEINYKFINFITMEGIKKYEQITSHVNNFNNRFLEEIKSIIEEGKKINEISSSVDSKVIAMNILSSIQSTIVLWIMNQNIDIKVLFETSYNYLWYSLKSYENYCNFR